MPAQAGKYTWGNGRSGNAGGAVEEELCVTIPIADSVKGKDVDYKLSKKSLMIGIKGEEPIIDDTLCHEVDPEESAWEIEKDDQGRRCIMLILVKKNKWEVWNRLVACEAAAGAADSAVGSGDAAGRYAACLRANPDPESYQVPTIKGSSQLGKRIGDVSMSLDKWREKLPTNAFLVLRLKATEPGKRLRFPLGFDDLAEDGIFCCAACAAAGEATVLYTSKMKFDCGCGWPGFWTNVQDAVYEQKDADGRRCEVLCARCDGHLGHVFRGERWSERFGWICTDERHCVNSLSLVFIPVTGGSIIAPTYTGDVHGAIASAAPPPPKGIEGIDY
eukprot:TRINITY_DN51566_c0_g1_i1.p1 TRINITY_DN51566_c0_g1~~TRINITY_DN51566_c0_g1_i1.p1  ORF type:complete len:332 (-),score=70.40 TRINITY_DN51566_c0_g1_i1:162-1157(-)